MMIIRRLLANIVDIFVFFIVIIGFFVFVLPIFGEGIIAIVALMVASTLLPFLLQYPFMKVGQTIGKAFFGLRIVSTNKNKPITPFVIFHREVMGKVMSCYLICIPVLFGKIGPHEVMTETRVENQ